MKFEKNFFIKIEKTKIGFDMANKTQTQTKKIEYIFVEVITNPKLKIRNRKYNILYSKISEKQYKIIIEKLKNNESIYDLKHSGSISVVEDDLIKNSKKYQSQCKKCKFYNICINNRKESNNNYKHTILNVLRKKTCNEIDYNFKINNEIKVLEIITGI